MASTATSPAKDGSNTSILARLRETQNDRTPGLLWFEDTPKILLTMPRTRSSPYTCISHILESACAVSATLGDLAGEIPRRQVGYLTYPLLLDGEKGHALRGFSQNAADLS